MASRLGHAPLLGTLNGNETVCEVFGGNGNGKLGWSQAAAANSQIYGPDARIRPLLFRIIYHEQMRSPLGEMNAPHSLCK